jgi:hypothetical protein
MSKPTHAAGNEIDAPIAPCRPRERHILRRHPRSNEAAIMLQANAPMHGLADLGLEHRRRRTRRDPRGNADHLAREIGAFRGRRIKQRTEPREQRSVTVQCVHELNENGCGVPAFQFRLQRLKHDACSRGVPGRDWPGTGRAIDDATPCRLRHLDPTG